MISESYYLILLTKNQQLANQLLTLKGIFLFLFMNVMINFKNNT